MSKKDERAKIRREKIRNDKIFNNGYKQGEGLREEGTYEYQTEIKVHSSYQDNYMKDVYDYEESLDYSIGVGKIFELIEKDKEMLEYLDSIKDGNKIKIPKDEINNLFNKILDIITPEISKNTFYSPIYVLEVVASILGVNSQDPIKDYKKIFDSLDVSIQEELLTELNKKYHFLEGKMNRGKLH